MNKVICLDSHGDWLHVIERVPDADLSETLLDLKDDYYGWSPGNGVSVYSTQSTGGQNG